MTTFWQRATEATVVALALALLFGIATQLAQLLGVR